MPVGLANIPAPSSLNFYKQKSPCRIPPAGAFEC
jgi:hypothetical protein